MRSTTGPQELKRVSNGDRSAQKGVSHTLANFTYSGELPCLLLNFFLNNKIQLNPITEQGQKRISDPSLLSNMMLK